MARVSKKTIEIYLPSDLGYEKVAIATAESVAQKMGFSLDRVEDLKTAVGEAVTNAIEHGNQLNVEVKVLVMLTIQEKSLALNVFDQGRTPIPSLSQEREDREDCRGWGMFLIQNLMDAGYYLSITCIHPILVRSCSFLYPFVSLHTPFCHSCATEIENTSLVVKPHPLQKSRRS